MELKELQQHVRTLATLSETAAPVISCYLNKEQGFIERMRRRTALEGERQDMAQVIGVADEEILREIHEFGFTCETVKLLYLVPIVQIAWAEGKVTSRERKLIFEAARRLVDITQRVGIPLIFNTDVGAASSFLSNILESLL